MWQLQYSWRKKNKKREIKMIHYHFKLSMWGQVYISFGDLGQQEGVALNRIISLSFTKKNFTDQKIV